MNNKRKHLTTFLLFLALKSLALISFCQAQLSDINGLRIALMADVHFQDVFGDFQDIDYQGILNPRTNEFVTIRTMGAQLHSTRIFNENYFAFLAALEDVGQKGVKYVILPGDFSDDGQAVNVRGLKRILDHYSHRYGIRFFATTGNHDPVRPFSREAGKADYLGEDGKPQPVLSSRDLNKKLSPEAHPAIYTNDIQELGYFEILSILDNIGFFPAPEYLYWESPFSRYQVANYSYEKASAGSSLLKRQYPLPPDSSLIPDASYLVEPLPGLWLLALDANVYLPRDRKNWDPTKPDHYTGSPVGYKHVLSHKKHLINWVKDVVERAEKQNKTLVAFSHYPMLEFNDGASSLIENLLGHDAMQLYRVPGEEVARTFADAGVKIHFGGHMHINDTGIWTSSSGSSLINIQIPSLAAYIPAYKLLTIRNNKLMEIETIVLDSVPRYNELFELYVQEYEHLKAINSETLWNKEILGAQSYHEFTDWHLKELVRMRFLPDEWPAEISDTLQKLSGREILNLAMGCDKPKIDKLISDAGLNPEHFDSWNGFDLILDFYRLRNADRLALQDIGTERLLQYQIIFESLLNTPEDRNFKEDKLLQNLQELATIFQHFLSGAPASHFIVDLKSGTIEDLTVDANQ